MAIHLSIEFGDNTPPELLSIATLDTAKYWAKIGKELGLLYVPQIYQWMPIDESSLSPLLHELDVLRNAVQLRDDDCNSSVSNIDKLSVALRGLLGKTGWTASIG